MSQSIACEHATTTPALHTATLGLFSRRSKTSGSPEGKPLNCLVAGTGFEPVTFGL
jgi:hypothetical protein